MTDAFNEVKDYLKGQGLDIEMLVDCSGSMKQENRIESALEFAKAAAKIGAEVDEDGGIGLTFFSMWGDSKDKTWEDVKYADVEAKFLTLVAAGGTDTLRFLESKIEQHYDRKKTKPDQKTLIVMVTDGEPSGGQVERDRIKGRLGELQKGVDWTQAVPELKVLFYQVGKDATATAFLKDLDEDNKVCGLIVETAYDGKDNRTVEQIFLDAVREHLNP